MNKYLIAVALLLTACVSQQPAQPVTQPTRPALASDNNCCTKSYTVREPVEVIYKNTTYTTVYEPKTYSSVSYSRQPYTGCKSQSICR